MESVCRVCEQAEYLETLVEEGLSAASAKEYQERQRSIPGYTELEDFFGGDPSIKIHVEIEVDEAGATGMFQAELKGPAWLGTLNVLGNTKEEAVKGLKEVLRKTFLACAAELVDPV